MAQILVMLSMQAKHRILCVREIQKSIAQSSKRVIEDYINRMGLGAYFKINKQGEDQITCILTGSTFSFTGLQDHTADSIKSFEGATIVWVEEASNVSTNSWNKLIPTIVRTTGAEIWVTFNPDQQDDYAYKRWVLGNDPDAIVIQINWLDNPWWNQPMETERLKTLAISQDLHDHIFGGQPRAKAGILFKRHWFKRFNLGDEPKGLRKYLASDYAGAPDPDDPEADPDWTEHGCAGLDHIGDMWFTDWWSGQEDPSVWIAALMQMGRRNKPVMAFEEIHPGLGWRQGGQDREVESHLRPVRNGGDHGCAAGGSPDGRQVRRQLAHRRSGGQRLQRQPACPAGLQYAHGRDPCTGAVMTKRRVPLHQNPRGFVEVDPEATKGAQLGVNLLDEQGRLLTRESLAGNSSGGPNSIASTIWRLIREIPLNIQKLAALATSGFAVRRSDGEWATRTLQQGAGITISNPAGEAGDPAIGLADVPDSGAGVLLATTFDAKGRKTGSRPATITGTVTQINVANGTAAAGLPTLSLAAEVLASLGKADTALQEVRPGANVTVDNTDPRRPIVSAAGGGGFVPYNIPDGQSFYVPVDQQALFTLSINLGDGSSIVLDGALVEVS